MRSDGQRVLELYYPDGRLWAEWRYSPVDQGYIFYLADGTTVYMSPNQTPFWMPAGRIASGPRSIRIPGGPTAEGYGSVCPRGLPSISARAGSPLKITVQFRPTRVWVADRRGRIARLPARRTVSWDSPLRPLKPRIVAVGFRDDAQPARTGYYRFCLRPTK